MARVAHCRACDAPIRWARTAAKGRPMALDLEPAEDGTAWFGRAGQVHVLGKRQAPPASAPRYMPHVITCRVRVARRRTEAAAAAAAEAAEHFHPPAEITAELREIAPHLAARLGSVRD